jgi:hypothetical protein
MIGFRSMCGRGRTTMLRPGSDARLKGMQEKAENPFAPIRAIRRPKRLDNGFQGEEALSTARPGTIAPPVYRPEVPP